MRVEQPSVSVIFAPPAPMDGAGADGAIDRAHATLAAGCAFLLRSVEARTASPTDVYARLQGNRLRELDRFLSILLDEMARALNGPGHDAPGFARLRNTPNKLRSIATLQPKGPDASTPVDIRLRAIGRISACLNHCSGVVHAPGMHRDVLVACGQSDDAPAVSPALPPSLDRLRLSPETLDAISSFYREIGDRLLVEVHVASAQP